MLIILIMFHNLGVCVAGVVWNTQCQGEHQLIEYLNFYPTFTTAEYPENMYVV